ncbi:MAG: hypothetical protein ACI8PQ_001064 [Planctomycetota bacterium]|jgi:hypothetical protein
MKTELLFVGDQRYFASDRAPIEGGKPGTVGIRTETHGTRKQTV